MLIEFVSIWPYNPYCLIRIRWQFCLGNDAYAPDRACYGEKDITILNHRTFEKAVSIFVNESPFGEIKSTVIGHVLYFDKIDSLF